MLATAGARAHVSIVVEPSCSCWLSSPCAELSAKLLVAPFTLSSTMGATLFAGWQPAVTVLAPLPRTAAEEGLPLAMTAAPLSPSAVKSSPATRRRSAVLGDEEIERDAARRGVGIALPDPEPGGCASSAELRMRAPVLGAGRGSRPVTVTRQR